MSIRIPDDSMLPLAGDTRSARFRPAVFLPIAIALAGVAAILLGGLSARGPAAIGEAGAVDPMVTGSIQPVAFDQMSPAEQRHVLEMLDK